MPRPKQPPVLRPNDLAVIGVGLTIFALALGGVVGVGLAAWLFGDGWAGPSGVDGAAHELGGLLTGRPGHGLEADVARRLPGDVALWVVVVLVELVVLAAGILFARWAGQVVRPASGGSARPGASRLASKEEVAAALGRRRHPLRRAAGVVLRKVAPQIPMRAAPV